MWKFDENTHWNPCDDVTCSVHVNEAAHTFVWVNDEAESDISTRSIEARTKHEECTVCGYTRNENTPITPDPVVTPEPSANLRRNRHGTYDRAIGYPGAHNGTHSNTGTDHRADHRADHNACAYGSAERSGYRYPGSKQ